MVAERVAVVVLTWNHVRYTLECLQSLRQQTMRHAVYVVDNASSDGTPEIVASTFPEARIIVNRENLGFAAGNNVGLRAAFADGADAALVLNNDTTLAPDALAHLFAARHAYPDAGILSPAILLDQPPHRIWFAGAGPVNPWTGRSGGKLEGEPETALPPTVCPTGWVSGCAMLVTRAYHESVGGFDARFFMYIEDVEYALRARGAGFGVYLVPDAVIYHHVSASSGEAKPANGIYYGVRNSLVMLDQHFPKPRPIATARRLCVIITMLAYIAKTPPAPARIADILAGYRDARRGRLGRRGAVPA